jgi:hypothetical protein
MKVRIVVTDSGGHTFEGGATLVAVDGARPPRQTPGRKPRVPARPTLDFSLPVRAFVKRHAKSVGGPQKFTVLLARLSGGKTGAAVALKEIEKTWKRMTGPIGGKYNSAYTRESFLRVPLKPCARKPCNASTSSREKRTRGRRPDRVA